MVALKIQEQVKVRKGMYQQVQMAVVAQTILEELLGKIHIQSIIT